MNELITTAKLFAVNGEVEMSPLQIINSFRKKYRFQWLAIITIHLDNWLKIGYIFCNGFFMPALTLYEYEGVDSYHQQPQINDVSSIIFVSLNQRNVVYFFTT